MQSQYLCLPLLGATLSRVSLPPLRLASEAGLFSYVNRRRGSGGGEGETREKTDSQCLLKYRFFFTTRKKRPETSPSNSKQYYGRM